MPEACCGKEKACRCQAAVPPPPPPPLLSLPPAVFSPGTLPASWDPRCTSLSYFWAREDTPTPPPPLPGVWPQCSSSEPGAPAPASPRAQEPSTPLFSMHANVASRTACTREIREATTGGGGAGRQVTKPTCSSRHRCTARATPGWEERGVGGRPPSLLPPTPPPRPRTPLLLGSSLASYQRLGPQSLPWQKFSLPAGHCPNLTSHRGTSSPHTLTSGSGLFGTFIQLNAGTLWTTFETTPLSATPLHGLRLRDVWLSPPEGRGGQGTALLPFLPWGQSLGLHNCSLNR